MIRRMVINNVFSIDNCDISFEKSKYKFLNQFTIQDKIANPIAVYGRNGSGKSSFIEVFNCLLILLTSEIDKLTPLIPNFSSGKDNSSLISLYFDIDGNNYEYYIRTNIEKIIEETLIKDDKEIFNRKDNKYFVEGIEYSITSNLYPALRDYANKNNNSTIYKAYDYLSNIAYIGADKKLYIARTLNHENSLDAMVNKSNEVKDLLRKYKSFPIYDIGSYIDEQTRTKNYYVTIEKNDGSFTIPYSFASNGMRNQSFMLSTLLSLPPNGVMVVDELEDALHPLTIMNFINVAISKSIQLIFVSHNTNTLSQLRPDNIVFANWKNGKSTYKRLCDIYPNIREVNNIEKMYLSSVFDEEIEK